MIFEISKLRFSYKSSASSSARTAAADDKRFVFADLSLQIPRGRTIAVVGNSGVGKSTLLYLLGLLGDHNPADGSIRYCPTDGRQPIQYGRLGNQAVAIRSRDFGFALQSSYLMPTLTCAQNVALPLALRGYDLYSSLRAVQLLIAAADPLRRLAEISDNYPSQVSGGQKQRFGLLRALIHNPQVLFADEPFSSIDDESFGHVRVLISRWKADALHDEQFRQVLGADSGSARDPVGPEPAQRSCLIVIHDLNRALEVADAFLVFHRDGVPVQGRILQRDELPPDDQEAELQLLRWMHETSSTR